MAVAQSRPSGESGLVTLDWLLVLAAIAGIAAASVLAVQRVLDDETDIPTNPAARLVEADVAAAIVMHEALELAIDGYYDAGAEIVFRNRCEQIADSFSDVVESATWNWNQNWTPHYLAGEDQNGNELPDGTRLNPARCDVTPRILSSIP